MSGIIGALERDAVEEILNIAIGQAAASLSRMVRDTITLSVPLIEFLSPAAAAEKLDRATGGTESIAVRQNFVTTFSGNILLIFPERRSLDLVRSMLGDTLPVESLSELEQEALMEVGNVILNACLGSLANQLKLNIESSLPIYIRGRGSRLLESKHPDTEIVMFLQVDFTLATKGVQGYLAFVMDIVSARRFAESVTDYVTRVVGG